MSESKLYEKVDDFLRKTELKPMTVPAVLNENRIPSDSNSSDLREVEDFLLTNFLVEKKESVESIEIPGGWALLQVTKKGYDLVSEGVSVKGMMYREKTAAERKLDQGRVEVETELRREKARKLLDAAPEWWKQSGGGSFNDEYDEEYEYPIWWAKYRLRQMQKSPYSERFLIKWWERRLDYLFVNRVSITVFWVTTVVIGVIIYVAVLLV